MQDASREGDDVPERTLVHQAEDEGICITIEHIGRTERTDKPQAQVAAFRHLEGTRRAFLLLIGKPPLARAFESLHCRPPLSGLFTASSVADGAQLCQYTNSSSRLRARTRRPGTNDIPWSFSSGRATVFDAACGLLSAISSVAGRVRRAELVARAF